MNSFPVKRFALLTSFVCIFVCTAPGADQRIAFEKDDAVHIANLEGSVIRNLTNGIFPAISPDAKSVAFTTVDKTDGHSIRRLAVIEVASGQRQVFSGIPGDNAYNAAWSPDGKSIAFTLQVDGLWHLGMINTDGTDFKFIKKGEQDQVTLYSPCWARDGKSIFCEDMTNIYRLSLEGAILAQWKITTIVPNGGMSGDSRIDVSPDGNRLLLSVEMDEAYDRKDWDGPVPALWSFDLLTESAVRLTTKSLFAW